MDFIKKLVGEKNLMTKLIEFFDEGSFESEYPMPASKFLPNWYKQMPSYSDDVDGKKKPHPDYLTTASIKRCVPVFDAISAGYLITTAVDIYVSQVDGRPWFQWTQGNYISFHANQQLSLHPTSTGADAPKINNFWGIKTPIGYSCLFVPPLHRDNQIVIFPGIVDTDTYHVPTNFPFSLANPKFEGIIPKGTPFVQVIPFKRENWKSEHLKSAKLIESQKTKIVTVFFDAYRKLFWQRKTYN